MLCDNLSKCLASIHHHLDSRKHYNYFVPQLNLSPIFFVRQNGDSKAWENGSFNKNVYLITFKNGEIISKLGKYLLTGLVEMAETTTKYFVWCKYN